MKPLEPVRRILLMDERVKCDKTWETARKNRFMEKERHAAIAWTNIGTSGLSIIRCPFL
jgi:hypothetical protein